MQPWLKSLCIVCFRISAIIPDPLYLKIVYRIRVRKKCNLKNPQCYTEKLQRMKLDDHNPLYTQIADKYGVRKFVEDRIGNEYLTKLYGVYNSEKEIEYDKLPQSFVLKATHDSGGCIIVHDKDALQIDKVNKKLSKLLKRNFYWKGREWGYKNIKPRIICEELLEDSTNKDILDYKFFCFHGEPKLLYVASDRINGTKFDFFDLDFNHLDIKNHYPNSTKTFSKPRNFEKMIELARCLSQGFQQVRVDFYNIEGKIYFGEMTLYHMSGLERFEPDEWDYKIGAWW